MLDIIFLNSLNAIFQVPREWAESAIMKMLGMRKLLRNCAKGKRLQDSQPKLDSRRMLAYLVHEARILEKQNGQYRARRCSRALKMKVKLSSMQTHIACGYACA